MYCPSSRRLSGLEYSPTQNDHFREFQKNLKISEDPKPTKGPPLKKMPSEISIKTPINIPKTPNPQIWENLEEKKNFDFSKIFKQGSPLEIWGSLGVYQNYIIVYQNPRAQFGGWKKISKIFDHPDFSSKGPPLKFA